VKEGVKEGSGMMPKRDRAIDIARELVRLIDAGTPGKEIVAAISQAFPGLSSTEIERARLVGLEQIDLWLENQREHFGRAFDLLANGAPAEEIAAAVDRTRTTLNAETLFPKPDKAKS
jgi:hypothetical protein